MRACKKCTGLTEEEVCPKCKTTTTQYWTGYLGVIDPASSEIAKRLDIKQLGQYALKVR
jgi:DNA-directed RNA polymerase subunit E"